MRFLCPNLSMLVFITALSIYLDILRLRDETLILALLLHDLQRAILVVSTHDTPLLILHHAFSAQITNKYAVCSWPPPTLIFHVTKKMKIDQGKKKFY